MGGWLDDQFVQLHHPRIDGKHLMIGVIWVISIISVIRVTTSRGAARKLCQKASCVSLNGRNCRIFCHHAKTVTRLSVTVRWLQLHVTLSPASSTTSHPLEDHWSVSGSCHSHAICLKRWKEGGGGRGGSGNNSTRDNNFSWAQIGGEYLCVFESLALHTPL